MSTALVKHEQADITTSELATWTREQVDLIKRAICPKGISDDEFRVFIHQCQKTGMDPLTKEAFCVPRRTNIGTKENPKWVTNHVFQASADGMRARAARFPDFVSVRSAPVYEKDPKCEIDTDAGTVKHVTDPTKPRGRLVGAWAKVTKRGDDPVVVFLPVGSRVMKGDFWTADPANMMCKCSEVAALRKAYPVQFSGQHIPEELTDEEREPTRAEVVLGTAAQVKEDAPPALPPAGPAVQFGPWKGRLIEELTPDEKQEALAYAQRNLDEHPKLAKKAKETLTANMEQLRASLVPKHVDAEDAEMMPPLNNVAEEALRNTLPISHPDAEPPNEPGSEG